MKIDTSLATSHAPRYATTSRWAMVACAVVALSVCQAHASAREHVVAPDWPTWRHDANRSGVSPAPLPEKLHLQWVRELPQPAPAWSEEQYKLQFDRSYEPVVMGHQIFVGSMVRDNVTAYDTETGRQNWRFYCDGPVRFAPIAWQGRVYFVSDDGNLYCLDAEGGRLLWTVSLAPDGRKLLGNGRLISSWPARGGPVLRDGTIYCTAGIWPFMGVFVYAIDAETGCIVWANSGTGAIYIQQQHSSPAFGGAAPQGYLAAADGKLLVTGRTTPACFDTRTGELLYYPLSDRSYGKHVGGCSASIWNEWYFNNDIVYRLADGLGMGVISGHVMGEDGVVGIRRHGDLMAYKLAQIERKDRKSKKIKIEVTARPIWQARPAPALERIYLQAGRHLYGGDDAGLVAALAPPTDDEPARIVWSTNVEGKVWTVLAGDHKLFVVTEQGRLYCFGARKTDPRHYRDRKDPAARAFAEHRDRARLLLQQASDNKGYALWLGGTDSILLKEVLRRSEKHIVVLEPDAARVASLRVVLDRAGLYGSRVHVLPGDINSMSLPPYWVSLIIVEDPVTAGLDTSASLEGMYDLLRPYTGAAWLYADKRQQLNLYKQLANADLPGCRIEALDRALVIRRAGAVPGSADWTHQYGDVANTVCSNDQLRPPLGLLWFGGESAFGDVLPRHGHGPPEQVVAGRLFIEGLNSLSARDVYTGRTLWQRTLKSLDTFGVYYDTSYKHDFRDLSYNQEHLPGANTRGTNFVATADRIYVVQKAECHVLDAQTGVTERIFLLPGPDELAHEDWGYIGVYEDYLIAGLGYGRYSADIDPSDKDATKWASFFDTSASQQLAVMDRHTGRVLWRTVALHGFIHNGIVAGDGKLFCLDAPPPYLRKKARDMGIANDPQGRLLALDIRNGQTVWSDHARAFGSWLSFSESFGVLLEAHRKSRDMVWEPGNRMAAFHAETGAVIWDREIEHSGPCILRGGTIITQESAYSLLTGRQQMRRHPLTNERVPWKYARNYGCGTAIGSRNLLTFRSAAAGYFDLTCDGGTGNFGGFRSGCTSNLVVANGVLNAPDYTRTCTCSYQNQTSLAMVHMPDVETWTFSDIDPSTAPIQRVGINFGAPGDRKADNGTLWLEYPGVGGTSPELDIAVTPERPSWFRRHSLCLEDGNLKWVEASGAQGLRSIRVRVAGAKESTEATDRIYTVRLHFIEPDGREPGQRLFDVAIGNKTVLKNFDIADEAQAPDVGIVKEFTGIRAADHIVVSLTPADPDIETVICGIEIVAQTEIRY
ncbi:MAG: PQQ-binding-like beta-propeller repeat protein [Phycisphaerales bacterium]|nr:MAG: PQQ-binding-like beta-propeller repeat protein [Phycisphaerales bacterium]